MITIGPKSQQTLIYLTGGFTMMVASVSIFNSLSMNIFLLSLTVGILSITQIERQFARESKEPSAWGLNLLRISRKVAPEAYTSIEITPRNYTPRAQIQESVTLITAHVISKIAKHVKTEKTAVKIDELEDTSLLYIQIKGMAHSELEANQLIEQTNEEIEGYVRELNGSTMYQSENGETAILIEFPNKQ